MLKGPFGLRWILGIFGSSHLDSHSLDTILVVSVLDWDSDLITELLLGAEVDEEVIGV